MTNPLKVNIYDTLQLLREYHNKNNYLDTCYYIEKLYALVAKLPEEKEIYFLQADVGLTEAQYARLKANIDEVWPATKPRPVLLEGVRVVKL